MKKMPRTFSNTLRIWIASAHLGGLHVIGSERHEARRIDNQLRGRSARQGDPGSSRFYLSLDDDLMRLFGGQQVDSLMQRLSIDEAIPIESGIIGRMVEQSQTRVEGANFDVRKHLLEYDDVLNSQRMRIYSQRDQVFSRKTWKKISLTCFKRRSSGGCRRRWRKPMAPGNSGLSGRNPTAHRLSRCILSILHLATVTGGTGPASRCQLTYKTA